MGLFGGEPERLLRVVPVLVNGQAYEICRDGLPIGSTSTFLDANDTNDLPQCLTGATGLDIPLVVRDELCPA